MIVTGNQNMCDVIPEVDESDTSVNVTYECTNCGSSMEFYECIDANKHLFEHWHK